MKRRLLAVLLAVCLVVGCWPMSVNAAAFGKTDPFATTEMEGKHDNRLDNAYYNDGNSAFISDQAIFSKATEYGLLKYIDNMDMDGSVTRVDLCVLLANIWASDMDFTMDVDLPYHDCDQLTKAQMVAIKWAVENGLTSGVGRDQFWPYGAVTRAQGATLIWRALGQPAPTNNETFGDVENPTFYNAVCALSEYGIFTEEQARGQFRPNYSLEMRDALRWLTVIYEYLHYGEPLPPVYTPTATPRPTATPTPSPSLSPIEQQELKEFLARFSMFWDSSYDSQDALHSLNNTPGINIVEAMVTAPYYRFYNDALYPGEKAEYQLDGSDPLNRLTYHFPSWGRISRERVEWILENIFNVPQSDISQMERSLLEKNPNAVYLLGNYYYFGDGGIGWDASVQNLDVKRNGNLYTATYEIQSHGEIKGQYEAVVERKTIDGISYWTLHSVSINEKPPVPTATPTPTPDPTTAPSEQQELESFLYGYRWWHASYDCNHPTAVGGRTGQNIFEAALSSPSFSLLNDDLYPGENWALYRYGEFDHPDPLGRFPDGYAKVNQEKLKWILRNIYNVPSADIDTMERNALAKPDCSFYQYQGYYYFEGGYLASSGPSVRDVEIHPDGAYYKVSYNYVPNMDDMFTPSNWEHCSAVFERKTIDGATYWAMRSHSEQSSAIAPTPTLSPDVLNVTESTDNDGTLTRITTWTDGHKATAIKNGYGNNGFSKITVTGSNSSVIADVHLVMNPGPGKNFADVKAGSWYKSAVDAATGYGLFSGTSSTQFSPNTTMTRAMLATVLYRLSGNVKYGLGTGVFSDVPASAWYKDAVDWAQATGIVAGVGNGKFNPNGQVTREQLVTILYRYSNLIGEYSENLEYLSSFSDAHKVHNWATKAMDWAVAKGFIIGRNGNIVPQGAATRAEVATILVRFIEFINFKDSPSAFYICKRCGKSTNVVPVSRYGYCDECYDIVLARSCQICGKKIREIDCNSHADYIVKWNNYICSDCYYSHYCPTCQKVSTNVWEGYCDICDPGPRCKNCGARGFGRGLTDNGYCWDCYELLFP